MFNWTAPKGDNLSCHNFNVLEDLEIFLQDNVNSGLNIDEIIVKLLLFADEMVILGRSPSDLQNSLDLLHDYCQKWRLNFNITKTKIVVFRKCGPLRSDEKLLYNG